MKELLVFLSPGFKPHPGDDGLPQWLIGKKSTCKKNPVSGDTGDAGLVPGPGRSPGEEMAMTAVFLLGKFCGLQSIGSQRVRHN